MNARTLLSALAVVALLVGIVAITATVDAAPNLNVPVAPALPQNVAAAPMGASLTTPWNCAPGDMAGGVCTIVTDVVMTVGFQNPNSGQVIGQKYLIKLTSDGSSVTATDVTNGANNVIAWTQPNNAAANFSSMVDFLQRCVIKLKNAGAFTIQPSL